ncbi:hypothetical protein QTP88_001845 [Uroleucon formosanum]
MARKIMNDEQLLEILFQTNWSDSEDDFENSDNENEETSIHVPENIAIPSNNVEDLYDMPVELQFNNGDFIVLSQDPVDLSIQENNGTSRNNVIEDNLDITPVGEGLVEENNRNSRQSRCMSRKQITPQNDSIAATPTTSD